MDLCIDRQRLQISPKETNTCRIMGEHNPMYELVSPPLNLNLIKSLEKPIFRKYKRWNLFVFNKIQTLDNST